MEMLDRWPHASHRRTSGRQKLAAPLPAPLWGVVPRPASMRRATHGRLVRKHNRLLQRLQRVPYRPFPGRVRKRIETRLRNQLRRVRRRLCLPEAEPRRRRWYPVSAAADFLAISPRTLLRWSAAGRIETWQTPGGHRRFHARDLARLREGMRV
jgi:excisionase family DNA binding protein